MNIAILKTARLILRPLRSDDAQALHNAFSDKELMTFWSSGPHENVEETRAYVSVNANDERYNTWAITLKNDEALGWVVFVCLLYTSPSPRDRG